LSTIAEVAREAGVGVATVSRVLNGSPSVREETRERVLAAIKRLGYVPNTAARALSTGRTGTIGVIAPFLTRPSVVERLRGVSRVLAQTDYLLILYDVERPEQRGEFFRTLAGGGRLDGLLCISLCPTDDELAPLAAAGVPAVLVDHAHDKLPAVSTDDVEGGRLATEHLIALGHERIAFVGDDEADNGYGFTSSARRRTGWSRALAAAGLPAGRDLVRTAEHGRAAAAAAARELLTTDDPPTAMFAASDIQALGVLEAAEEVGVAVPDELSVIGFDDIELARWAGLTTVAQPLEDSGACGAELLLAALAGAPARGRRLTLGLVRRMTTAPPGNMRGSSSRIQTTTVQ
jgi:DNA-binding LacI/PurR family transcriptional regulator